MFTRNQELFNYDSNECYNKEKKTFAFQTERRQWDKGKTVLNLEYPDQEKILMNKKRYEEYLFKLHVNNQLSKMATKKDGKEEKMEKLEEGFSIYVNGAHKKNEKYTPRYTVTKSSDSKKNLNFQPNIHIVEQSNYNELRSNKFKSSKLDVHEKKERKKWGNSSFIIKTMEGYEIKINAPNSDLEQKSEPVRLPNENNHYSDDFESDSECEDEKISKTNKNLIQSVKFSDTSDSEDETNTNKKDPKIVFDLTHKEIKSLRDSLYLYDNLNKNENESEIETDSDLELDRNETKNSSQFIKSFKDKEKPMIKKIDEKVNEESDDSSEMCKIILDQVANLKLEDRMNLVKFLSNID